MRRREFIALFCGAVAWPLSVRAQSQQPSRLYRIAIVSPDLPSDMTEKGDNPRFRALFPELRQIGYIEGHNLVVERYSTLGAKEPFSELATSVVQKKPDLILAVGSDERSRAALRVQVRKRGGRSYSAKCRVNQMGSALQAMDNVAKRPQSTQIGNMTVLGCSDQ